MTEKNTWLELRIAADASAMDEASGVLYELDCNGIVEEPDCLKAYFDGERHDKRALLEAVRTAFEAIPALRKAGIEIKSEPAGDWSKKWKQYFKPFEIAPHVIVAPSWEHYSPKGDESLIELDPGMAFGTGLHPTTRLCAELLARVTLDVDSAQCSLLDMGTGSGILAILGRKLGIKRIAATDVDPDALRVARENLSKNGCADVELASDFCDIEGRFHIVVANILLSTLLELKSEIAEKTVPGGFLILSGITHDQEAEIAAAYSESFADAVIYRDGEWSAFTCMRRS
ncbi:MAG: 50S ribosomal protein L11 methyltransferase [bacterium]